MLPTSLRSGRRAGWLAALLAMLVLLVPEILVVLVATPIVIAGCGMILLAMRVRRHRRTVREAVEDLPFFFFSGKHRW